MEKNKKNIGFVITIIMMAIITIGSLAFGYLEWKKANPKQNIVKLNNEGDNDSDISDLDELIIPESFASLDELREFAFKNNLDNTNDDIYTYNHGYDIVAISKPLSENTSYQYIYDDLYIIYKNNTLVVKINNDEYITNATNLSRIAYYFYSCDGSIEIDVLDKDGYISSAVFNMNDAIEFKERIKKDLVFKKSNNKFIDFYVVSVHEYSCGSSNYLVGITNDGKELIQGWDYKYDYDNYHDYLIYYDPKCVILLNGTISCTNSVLDNKVIKTMNGYFIIDEDDNIYELDLNNESGHDPKIYDGYKFIKGYILKDKYRNYYFVAAVKDNKYYLIPESEMNN